MEFWLPNPRFPAGYKDRVESLAAQRGSSVGALIVSVVLEHVDASQDPDTPVGAEFDRTCGHPVSAPTRLRSSGARVCWCGAAVK